jgi:hypothetical protein
MQNRITDNDSYKLSDAVYDSVEVGRSVAEGRFKVLAVENNINNGMKAMAVAPVDKN